MGIEQEELKEEGREMELFEEYLIKMVDGLLSIDKKLKEAAVDLNGSIHRWWKSDHSG